MKKNYMEYKRWILNPMFLFGLIICTLLLFFDVNSSDLAMIFQLEGYKEGGYSALYIFFYRSPLLQIASLCLVTIFGAVMYAQDYEHNAIYMRIQRMGVKRYIFSRVFQTVCSSFLCGFFSVVLVLWLMHIIYQIPILPVMDSIPTYRNELLENEQYISYIFCESVLLGGCYMYYSLCALIFSFFLPKKNIIIAVPMILWYLNQFFIPGIEWLPDWLKPSLIFATNCGLGGLSEMSEWMALVLLAVYMFVMIMITITLFYIKLRRDGIFGGEEE